MATSRVAPASDGGPRDRSLLRRSLLAIAIGRYLTPIAVLPFLAVLVPERVPIVILLRPGKEWLLLGGGLNRMTGDPTIAMMLAAFVPLGIASVWAFFWLGRVYADELRAGEGHPWLRRVLRPDQLEIASRVLARRGPAIAVLGRIAAMPPTLLAAAAGTSTISPWRYLAADLAGALVAFAMTVGVGVALGGAYERAGPWLTAAGLGLFVVLIALLTRWLRREAARDRD